MSVRVAHKTYMHALAIIHALLAQTHAGIDTPMKHDVIEYEGLLVHIPVSIVSFVLR